MHCNCKFNGRRIAPAIHLKGFGNTSTFFPGGIRASEIRRTFRTDEERRPAAEAPVVQHGVAVDVLQTLCHESGQAG